MPLTLSPEHATARAAVSRLPALEASLARLVKAVEAPSPSTIVLYDHADPDDLTANAIVTLSLSDSAGTIDEAEVELVLDTPMEAQVAGADAQDGSVPLSARFYGPTGTWEFDATVTITGGGGHIEMEQTGTDPQGDPEVRLYNGAFARIETAKIGG